MKALASLALCYAIVAVLAWTLHKRRPSNTLSELRDANPRLFYQQTWWDDELFAHRDDPTVAQMPRAFEKTGREIPDADLQASAVQLAQLYVRWPDDPMWRNKAWTCDRDESGNPVYVVDTGKGLEIHRALSHDDAGVFVW